MIMFVYNICFCTDQQTSKKNTSLALERKFQAKHHHISYDFVNFSTIDNKVGQCHKPTNFHFTVRIEELVRNGSIDFRKTILHET